MRPQDSLIHADIIEGDFSSLISKLRSDESLSTEMRGILADILEGKYDNPSHRRTKRSTVANHLKMGKRVHELRRQMNLKSAIYQATQEFGCRERTVREGMRLFREQERRESDYRERLENTLRVVLNKTLPADQVEKTLEYAKQFGFLAKKQAT